MSSTNAAPRPTNAMPPPGAAWSLLRDRRQFWVAIVISLAIHVVAYVSSPRFISVWRDATAARYDAVLLPPRQSARDSEAISRPAAAPSRQPRRALTRPRPQPAPVIAAADAGEGEPLPSVDANASAVASALAGPVETVAENRAAAAEVSPPVPEPPPAAEPAAARAAEAPPPDLPSKISISFKATSNISDGVADYTWKRNGNRYEVDSSLQASGFVMALLAGVLHQVSRGEITADGLQPETFMMRRGDSEPDTADFLRGSNEIRLTRGGKSRLVPLPARIQDTQSFLFQLAFDAPRLKSPTDKLELLVTNARKVYRHSFRQLGEVTIETRFGPVRTLHLLSDAADPEDAYEVWLSPEHFHLPVKLKFFAGRFPIELIATSIGSTP